MMGVKAAIIQYRTNLEVGCNGYYSHLFSNKETGPIIWRAKAVYSIDHEGHPTA